MDVNAIRAMYGINQPSVSNFRQPQQIRQPQQPISQPQQNIKKNINPVNIVKQDNGEWDLKKIILEKPNIQIVREYFEKRVEELQESSESSSD